jgi:hypothetical protein
MANAPSYLAAFVGGPSLHKAVSVGAMSVAVNISSPPILPIPPGAMAFKLNFLRDRKDAAQERKVQSEDRSRLPLEKAAELYFNWKAADISPRTITREKRLFKSVEKFIGGKRTVRSIDLQLLEEYQEERRKQISPTMKKAVTARTVNYELAFYAASCGMRRVGKESSPKVTSR